MGSLSIITIILIAANVIISMKGFTDFAFFEKYKFNIAAIRKGEYFRLFSSAFLHVNTMHLFFNMFTLFFFAEVIIQTAGTTAFLLIYVVSLIVGNLLSYHFHKNEYHYSAVGASGAVTGVLYSAILFYPNMGLYLFFIPIEIPAWIFGILYLLYSIYGMKKQLGNIGHDAHFGGAAAGYLVTLLIAPYLFQQQLWIILLLAVPIIILFIMQRSGRL
ncbi:MAG: rhomboid family intramembrane serine protease [Bacteroidetes bacterium HGW-Bacteroidetes-2]|jgi:membrane associated rhomboid family serine protease|nr:MAG: rhomboid family intramembrane serine protease [Bacteroidetes bacterium HGW-Bacteroidetes-2]